MKKEIFSCNLTTTLALYRLGECAREAVLAQASLFVYHRLALYPSLDEDSRQDFFLSFLPYLERTIDQFQLREIPFEHYLSMIIKRRIKTFFRRRNRLASFWRIAQDECISALYRPAEKTIGITPEHFARVLGARGDNSLPKQSLRKRFLVWAMRNCRRFSVADIPRIALFADESAQLVAEKIALLQKSMQNREERFSRLKERRNKLYFASRVLEWKILRELDPDKRGEMVAKLARRKRALANIRHRISRVNLRPTHRMIARVLGMPKGSVDSALARIHQTLVMRAEEVDRRPA